MPRSSSISTADAGGSRNTAPKKKLKVGTDTWMLTKAFTCLEDENKALRRSLRTVEKRFNAERVAYWAIILIILGYKGLEALKVVP